MSFSVLRRRAQDLASSLNSHRILAYSLVSTIAVSAAVTNALKQQSNFYSVTIQLSKSNRSVLILVNFGFLVALLCAHIVQQIFFGPLRAPEVERLYDRLWFFVTESLLAFTIFRDDFDIPFALMFGFLLFIKSFHWLSADRIEWMDQRPYPGPPTLFHFRMSGLFVLLWSIDCLMFLIAAEHTFTNGVSGMVLFASEYAILMATALNAIAKYVLSLYEIRRASQRGGENAPPWENKSMWTFYIELSTDFLKLTTYLIFFAVIITFYGLPLNIIRDVYITARSFISRLRALHRYQTATRNMDQRYPNATAEELSAMSDRTCIICREEMSLGVNADPRPQSISNNDGPNTTPKKLPCGHIFHFHCLRSWLERQQNCPTCRRTVLDTEQPARPAAPGDPVPGPAPPPPQPGVAIPQQPLPVGIAGMPGQQPPNNDPAGFLGRMLGYANQLPGQLPQYPGVNGNNVRPQHYAAPFNPGQVQQGIVVQYHIQLPQPPRPQQQTQPQTSLPRFAGFQGPAGVWQPWEMDQRWVLPDNAVQTTDPTVSSTDATLSPNTINSTRIPAPSNLPPSPPAISADTPGGSDNSQVTGRPISHLHTDMVASGTHQQEPGVRDRSRVTPAKPPSVSSTPTSVPAVDRPGSIPGLIPLFDYRSPPPTPQILAPRQPSNNTWQRRLSSSGQNSQTYQPFPIPLTQQGTQQAQPRPAGTRIPSANAQTSPLSQLPPTLTDGQLSVMDNLTREAIDERLRVLEGVSGAIFRCIDELLRMRSVLPRSSATVGAGHAQVPPPTTSLEDREAPARPREESTVAEGSGQVVGHEDPVPSKPQISTEQDDCEKVERDSNLTFDHHTLETDPPNERS